MSAVFCAREGPSTGLCRNSCKMIGGPNCRKGESHDTNKGHGVNVKEVVIEYGKKTGLLLRCMFQDVGGDGRSVGGEER